MASASSAADVCSMPFLRRLRGKDDKIVVYHAAKTMSYRIRSPADRVAVFPDDTGAHEVTVNPFGHRAQWFCDTILLYIVVDFLMLALGYYMHSLHISYLINMTEQGYCTTKYCCVAITPFTT